MSRTVVLETRVVPATEGEFVIPWDVVSARDRMDEGDSVRVWRARTTDVAMGPVPRSDLAVTIPDGATLLVQPTGHTTAADFVDEVTAETLDEFGVTMNANLDRWMKREGINQPEPQMTAETRIRWRIVLIVNLVLVLVIAAAAYLRRRKEGPTQ